MDAYATSFMLPKRYRREIIILRAATLLDEIAGLPSTPESSHD
jgi:hypothetical protein